MNTRNRLKQYFGAHPFAWVLLLFLVCEIIVNPTGNFPLNDDWTYAGSVRALDERGEIYLGNFASMTLFTQIIWGYVFLKIFGFSFFIMRLSSMVSAMIGLFFLYRLILRITGNRPLSMVACVTLMLNPMVFCLTNTFMTDVNFNTLLILCLFFMYRYFEDGRTIHLFIFLLCSLLLVMLRQYGLVVPLCFIAASLFYRKGHWQAFLYGVAGLMIISLVLKYYEGYLRETGAHSYKFSEDLQYTSTAFWTGLKEAAAGRHQEVLRLMLMYSLPFAIVFLWPVLTGTGRKAKFAALVLASGITCFLFSGEVQEAPGIFSGTIVGPETFSQSFRGIKHNHTEAAARIMFLVKLVSVWLVLLVLLAGAAALLKKVKYVSSPPVVFFGLFIPFYAGVVFMTESYFDRYHIPLITVFIVLMSYFARHLVPEVRHALVPLLFWSYVSVAGTRDYLEWNRQRRLAYKFLRHELSVPPDRINGGFEINCWNDGWDPAWREFMDSGQFEYLIQFDREEGFYPLVAFEFQRYLPYKRDRVYIFKRTSGNAP